MGRFEGKVALVTGGASGIGRATCERLSAEGASVLVADINEGDGRATADKIGGEFVKLDVGDPAAWDAIVSTTTAKHGGLDIAYLNAGITTYPMQGGDSGQPLGIAPFDLATLPTDVYRRIMGVNVDGVVFGARAVAPALEAHGGGAIVATASVAGLIGFAPDPLYTLTKHAVIGWVRALAPPLAEKQITINAICPGAVATNILGTGFEARAKELDLPLMEPSQIADAVVNAITCGETGRAWVCLLGKDHEEYSFRPVPGIDLGGDN